jgi:hypothetical protein
VLLARGFGTAATAPDVATLSTNIAGSSSTTKTSQWPGTGTIKPGELVVATCTFLLVTGVTVTGMTDTTGTPWTVVTQAQSAAGGFAGCAIAWGIPIAPITRSSGSFTFTWTLSTAVTQFNAQFYRWNTAYLDGGITVQQHSTPATGTSTAVAIASANTPNIASTRTATVMAAAWDSANTGTAGGSHTERFDGAFSTGRYYGATRQDLAPNTASAPAATIATAAANWAACALAFTYQQQRNLGLRGSRSRPAVIASARV